MYSLWSELFCVFGRISGLSAGYLVYLPDIWFICRISSKRLLFMARPLPLLPALYSSQQPWYSLPLFTTSYSSPKKLVNLLSQRTLYSPAVISVFDLEIDVFGFRRELAGEGVLVHKQNISTPTEPFHSFHSNPIKFQNHENYIIFVKQTCKISMF